MAIGYDKVMRTKSLAIFKKFRKGWFFRIIVLLLFYNNIIYFSHDIYSIEVF